MLLSLEPAHFSAQFIPDSKIEIEIEIETEAPHVKEESQNSVKRNWSNIVLLW